MYENILVPIDLDDRESWVKALPVASQLCGTFGATLHALSVVPAFRFGLVAQFFPPDHKARMLATAKEGLEKLLAETMDANVTWQAHVAEGNIHQTIVEQARSLSCDLIVLSSNKDEVSHYILGTTGSRVVNESHVSVLVVR